MARLAEIAGTPVSDVTYREPIRVDQTAPLLAVVEQMREQRRGAVLVEDGNGVVGIFSERDLMKRVDHTDESWQQAAVSTVMTTDVKTVRTDETISKAITLMTTGGFRHLPLTDADGAVVAMLSIRDLLIHFVEYFPEDFVNLPPDPEHESSRQWGG